MAFFPPSPLPPPPLRSVVRGYKTIYKRVRGWTSAESHRIKRTRKLNPGTKYFLVTLAGTRACHFGSGTNLKREIWWQLRPQGLLVFQVRNFQYGCRCESLCSPQKNCKSMLFPTSLYPSGVLYNCKKVFVVI